MIRNPQAAASALDPAHRAILERLNEPNSAAGLARQLGIPRQKLNYHLRQLEAGRHAGPANQRRPGMKALVSLFSVAILGILGAPTCHGGPVFTLESQTGGTYNYSLMVTPTAVDIPPGNDIILSGLSGVTGASVTGSLGTSAGCFNPGGFSLLSFTSTTVTLQNETGSQCLALGTYANLAVTSTVTTPGTVDFEIDILSGPVYGTTGGPVAAAVPEPAAGVLVCLGIATLLLWRLQRRVFPSTR